MHSHSDKPGKGTIRVVVASRNPVKLKAAEGAFRVVFSGLDVEVSGVDASSGVSDQPVGDMETRRGAVNRALSARNGTPSADYWIGIEGGVVETDGVMESCAWIVVLGKDGKKGASRTGTFVLPEKVAGLIRDGKELGEADDIVFGRSGSKTENGAVGILTGNAIDRQKYYEHALILALIPFRNPDLF